MMRKQKYLVPILAMSLLLGGCFHEHTWIAATCIAPATCSECSETEGEPLPHNFAEANCQELKTCKDCGATAEEKGSHLFMDASCQNPKTCFYCRITEGEPLPHNWIGGTSCLYLKICDDCDFTENEYGPHNFVDDVCADCGYYVRPSVHPNAAYAAYFGIDPNIKWVENADTRDEIVNNILWNALNGDFDLDWIGNTPYRDSEDVFETIRAVSQVYPEIIGAYLNVMGGGRRGSNFYVEYDANPLPLSYDDVHNQNLAALAKAQAISKKLHDNGTITEDMSELDIVKVYYDYLDGYIGRCTRDESVEGTARDMFYDSAYACLVNKDAACGGKAAGFNMLMHVEGITAQGVAGQIIGTGSGHIMSRVVADGKEYFVDWGNQKPIGTYDQTCKWFNFNHEDSAIVLELARAAYQQ